MNINTAIIYIWPVFFFCYFHKGTNVLRGETIKMLTQFRMTMGTCIVIILFKTWLKKISKNYLPFTHLECCRKLFFPLLPEENLFFRLKINARCQTELGYITWCHVVIPCSPSILHVVGLSLSMYGPGKEGS